jgi:hypothetical protein
MPPGALDLHREIDVLMQGPEAQVQRATPSETFATDQHAMELEKNRRARA